ncbi:MAG: TonB-dependent receptor [Bacteroidales bacterium]|nr:TonB-dependent receptor [Bacteroidales bacterium]
MKVSSFSEGFSSFRKALRSLAAVAVLFIGAGSSMNVLAQTGTITVSGQVTCNGEAVIGASIMVNGTSNGTVADFDGNYSISATSDAVLTVSAIGYSTIEVPVSGRTKVDIVLTEDSQLLDDAVVVGYGVQKKVNLTGAVASVSTEDIKGKPMANVLEGLQGTTPGLVIQQGSSTPGGSPTINVRGLNTLNDNNPLVLIDGIEGSLASINPNDIEAISVLKDASSTAIYGSRASNGVILVTTKKGSEGRVEVNYNMNFGTQQPTALPTVVDSWLYAELYNEAAVNSGRTTKFTSDQIAEFRNGGTNCKWIREIYKDNATQQSHNLSVTGGTDKLSYMASLGFMNQNSLFKGPEYGYNRINARLNVSHKVTKRLTIGANAQFTRNDIKDHAYWTDWIIEQCNRMPAIYPIKNEDGTYTYPSGSNSNSLERLEKGGFRKSQNDDMSGTLNADWNIWDGLHLVFQGGARYLNNTTHENRYESDSDISGDHENHISESFSRYTKYTATAMLQYNKTFLKKHTVGAIAGYAYEGETAKWFGTMRKTEDHKYDVLGGDKTGDEQVPVSNNGGASDWSLYSFFARATYNYAERYLFEFNIRNDYSSYFAKGNRSGVFPSVSAGWRISQEDWYKPVKDYMSSLKLRGSWGLVGNNRIGAYRYMQTVTVNNGMVFGNQSVPSAGFSAVDPGIKWETTRMANIGVDMGFLNDNLTVSFDYFNNRTKDILVNLSVPGIFGNGAPTTNAAVVDTQGWELAVNYHFKSGIVNHSIAANVSDAWNVVVDTKGTELFGGYDVVTIIKEGYPMNSYYALRNAGLFQSDEEAMTSAHLDGIVPKAGDIKYIDKNGDGVINDEDRFVIGNDFPRYTFGFTYGLEVKGFYFSFQLQGVGKRSRWMRGESVEAFHNNNEGPVLDFHVDRWTPANPNASYPRLTMGAESANNATKSDFWIQNAAYMRLKNVQIGYNFPEKMLSKIHMKGLGIYATCSNPCVISGMRGGWDPEYNADGSGRAYPVARVISMGLNVKF